ncbi:MAG: NYN domain-containing protein [Candidatus Methanoplasma sp.]|jgi:uncharacterized LabA/DUF88 family protein|nr:NYN domain-containing protein [Candidatus Methanoplasma sp.]
MDPNSDVRIAVLVDAENISSRHVKSIFEKISNHGTATYRRAYGNWTSPDMRPWKEALQEYSLTPMQQFSNVSGKNSTDSAMIIDAMDIYYSQRVNGFAIVSSDSDFTKLASNLREKGMFVIGVGEEKTPKSMRAACTEFIELKDRSPAAAPGARAAAEKPAENPEKEDIRRRIEELIESSEGDRVLLSDVGTIFIRTVPPVDWTKWGAKKLSGFVEELGFKVEKEGENVLWITSKPAPPVKRGRKA